MEEEIQSVKLKITQLLKKEGVVRSSIFGSFARGENARDSDIDILVEFGKPTGFFAFIGLQQKLEEILRKKVDLLTYKSINPRLKKYIEKDEILIYEERS
jgi:predicted nucleotidyltransferase